MAGWVLFDGMLVLVQVFTSPTGVNTSFLSSGDTSQPSRARGSIVTPGERGASVAIIEFGGDKSF